MKRQFTNVLIGVAVATQETLDALVCKARAGDQQALAQLFEIYRDRLGRMLRLRMNARVQTRVAVSDVLQEAYVDLAQQLGNYAKDPKLPFFLWLRRITGQRLAKVHRAHLQQEMRDVGREEPLGELAMPDASSVYMARELAGQFTSVSEKAIRNENISRMQSAIETLPEAYREILALRHIEQLSNSEIAIVLDIGESGATNRYARAIRGLRTAMGE